RTPGRIRSTVARSYANEAAAVPPITTARAVSTTRTDIGSRGSWENRNHPGRSQLRIACLGLLNRRPSPKAPRGASDDRWSRAIGRHLVSPSHRNDGSSRRDGTGTPVAVAYPVPSEVDDAARGTKVPVVATARIAPS